MLANLLPEQTLKTLADNGSSPALSAANLAALIDGSPTTGNTFGGQSYTANLCTGGTPIESGHYSSYVAGNAFDGNSATFWLGGGPYPGWVGYQFTTAKAIAKIRILPYSDGSSWSGIKDFTVDGSNDGTNWTTVYTGIAGLQSSWQEFLFSSVTGYTCWRVRITSGYGVQGYPSIYGLEMMEAATGSLKVLLDISALTPATEVRYLTDETDTAKVSIKGSTDGLTYTTYSTTNPGAGYLSAIIGGLVRYVTIDHLPASAKTAYEIQIMAQRLAKDAAPRYGVYQPSPKSATSVYRVGLKLPAGKDATSAYNVFQKTAKMFSGLYHNPQRTAVAGAGRYHITQKTARDAAGAYDIRPPVPEFYDPADNTPVESLLLGLLRAGETAPEFVMALWNGRGNAGNGLKMTDVRITLSLEAEGQYTGGTNPDGQECLDAKWCEVRSDGVAGVGITDDVQTMFAPVGGHPAANGLAIGDIPPNTARYLHCRMNLPAQVMTAYAARPRFVVDCRSAAVCGFGNNHGTEFGG